MNMLPLNELTSQPWDSLDHEQIPLTTTQLTELDRRLDSFEQDRSLGIFWKGLKSELERRYS
jgi:putative addiction module component (TIGR02574 family)